MIEKLFDWLTELSWDRPGVAIALAFTVPGIPVLCVAYAVLYWRYL